MKSRGVAVLYLLLIWSAPGVPAQKPAESPTFPKVLFVNGSGEVLLLFDNNRKAFEVPSIGTIVGATSLRGYVDLAAKELGVKCKSFRLAGLFTYLMPEKSTAVIRPYLVAECDGYTDGRGPSNPGAKWFPVSAALKEIKYPASAMIVERVLKEPTRVWGASFEEHGYTNPVDPAKITFKVLENFYPLN